MHRPRLTLPSLCLAAWLAACGGGDAPQDVAGPQARARALAATYESPPPLPRPLDVSVLLNWAEATYPALFPGPKSNLTQAPYEYRYYPETGNYAGVAGDDVYILGPVSGNALQRVGTRDDFRCAVLPSTCDGAGYGRAGWSAALSTLQHGVSGVVSIVNERTLRITNFNYDGRGPLVWVYLGADNSNASFASGPAVGAQLQSRPYVNETIEVQLPEGQTLDGYKAVSIWCVQFSANFGSGTFFAPPK